MFASEHFLHQFLASISGERKILDINTKILKQMYNYARTYNNIFYDAINVKLLKMSFLSGNNCILFIKGQKINRKKVKIPFTDNFRKAYPVALTFSDSTHNQGSASKSTTFNHGLFWRNEE